MRFTRRQFIKDGVAAFTVSFAAPAFLSDLARAQGAASRNLVVLYLGGGNDALSTLVPYTDNFYYSRRPSLAVPAGTVLQVGSDSAGTPLGLHPNLSGLWQLYNQGRVAVVQRTGYPNSSRSHFLGTDIWSTADPGNATGSGWLGRYLDALPMPIDPLAGWCTVREVPRTLRASVASVPAIPDPQAYALQSPNGGVEATYSRATLSALASHLPASQPHLSFVNATAQAALATLDRVGLVAEYPGTVSYANDGLSQALKAVAGAIVRGIGTRVFWVQTGGYDNHSGQGTNQANGTYAGLMAILDRAVSTFYADLANQGLTRDTVIMEFSEFGRRVAENGSQGTDHGAAGLMMVIGGDVNGGLYGTAASLQPGNPTLENNSRDVTYETDFRSVYARVLDNWLGADSVEILGSDFRNPGLTFLS